MTRIVAGELRGRRLIGPGARSTDVRPTADRTKTILFDMLGPLEATTDVLDLFAGTGGLGIEALSRGAARATFVEIAPAALRILGENVSVLSLTSRVRIVRGDAIAFVERAARRSERWTLVLADPPYARPAASRVLGAAAEVVAPGGRLVLEHAAEDPVPERVAQLELRRRRAVGRTMLAIYEWVDDRTIQEED
jgi:16S rRNA (guanine(966)-N(2))-methyltransferase RsmD